jgi:hypothetical protein
LRRWTRRALKVTAQQVALKSVLAKRALFFLAASALLGCGGFPFECSESSVRRVVSRRPLDCKVVDLNLKLALQTMPMLPTDCVDRIQSIEIRSEEHWGGDGVTWWVFADTSAPGAGGPYNIRVNYKMSHLVHELGHVWLGCTTGDWDAGHRTWDSNGQRQRDIYYLEHATALSSPDEQDHS